MASQFGKTVGEQTQTPLVSGPSPYNVCWGRPEVQAWIAPLKACFGAAPIHSWQGPATFGDQATEDVNIFS